ncbi:group II intron reverse transcriptase/maturase [Microbulbifer sp. SH-1]|uniref:group II intron reverse transcriptase/maturase n=1 Tax=Microbulbifer sp. SH-1 TaxID=2681547 RepID=UPI00140EA287|nr:group II intron reverse transcriptase/maturase [Microbulbifer sp. SH-1]QIL89610.1 group II intron reverse transcriptase/maturase [Microbulbifer sp. SH-1]QIL91391.1 group II intron reverse transcriptase/maturase [Microbulbifer sp. SH-1]
MTAIVEHPETDRPRSSAGAPPAGTASQTDRPAMAIETARYHVHRLQRRIAKAVEDKRYNKARALQRLLTSSHAGKLLAAHRVMHNRGRKTPGIDGITWQWPQDRAEAIQSLQRRGYRAQPLRRISIPKANGKERPLGIPTMVDRAAQALQHLALEPWAEAKADRHSYGFRPKRSTADALQQCYIALSRRTCAEWVLDADIKGCFDHLSHEWLLAHIPMDKHLLQQWLKCGYIDRQVYYQTDEGTPQGGIISPLLANMALDGLEAAIEAAVPKSGSRVNIVRYADDIVITGASRELLEQQVKPALEAFLAERGLILSPEKTRIAHINEGFDFLGCNLRKYSGKLLTRPATDKVRAFAGKIRTLIKRGVALPTFQLLTRLNRVLRGWFNYYRPWVSKATFALIDTLVYRALWWWMRRRHKNRQKHWLYGHYTRPQRTPNGSYRRVFTGQTRTALGIIRRITLFKLSDLPIRRHTKIVAKATPHTPGCGSYFRKRWQQGQSNRRADRAYLARYQLAA